MYQYPYIMTLLYMSEHVIWHSSYFILLKYCIYICRWEYEVLPYTLLNYFILNLVNTLHNAFVIIYTKYCKTSVLLFRKLFYESTQHYSNIFQLNKINLNSFQSHVDLMFHLTYNVITFQQKLMFCLLDIIIIIVY